MTNGTILAVDDEALTLQIIQDMLEDDGFDVVTAENGKQALDLVMKDPEKFDAIVIDRMMPIMDGMAVLKALREDDRTSSIPVILQTAASSPEEMNEGIEAGAFYYITKPYNESTLGAIVQSAVQRHTQNKQFTNSFNHDLALLAGAETLEKGRFRISTLDDAKAVVWMICQHAEENAMATACLQELITNAIEHGNLGIGSATKEELIRKNCWAEEINRRLALPENAHKSVVIEFDATGDELEVSIEDEGQGFDWTPYFSNNLDLQNKAHGRGIVVARQMSAHSISYENDGRRVLVSFPRL